MSCFFTQDEANYLVIAKGKSSPANRPIEHRWSVCDRAGEAVDREDAPPGARAGPAVEEAQHVAGQGRQARPAGQLGAQIGQIALHRLGA